MNASIVMTYYDSLESFEEILQNVEVKRWRQDSSALSPLGPFATQQSCADERMQKIVDKTFRRMLRTGNQQLHFVGLDTLVGQHPEHPVAPRRFEFIGRFA
jgi:hypothetical protein